MLESDTYRAILDEGAIRHARELLLRWGQEKFGPANADVMTALQMDQNPFDIIDTEAELERLERLVERVPEVSSWPELLQEP